MQDTGKSSWQKAVDKKQLAKSNWQKALGKKQLAKSSWQKAVGKKQLVHCKLPTAHWSYTSNL